jgi:hypothetical protein
MFNKGYHMSVNQMDYIRKLFAGKASKQKLNDEKTDLISAYFGVGIRASRKIDQHKGKEHVHPLQNIEPIKPETSASCIFNPSSENKDCTKAET